MSWSSLTRRAAVATVLLFALIGCGQKGPVLHPVTGKITSSDGKPLERATVVFHPVGTTDPNAVKPRGTVGADGTFALTSYTSGDGAPSGEYRVTVELWSANKGDDPPTNRLPPKFANPEKSGLTATIGDGPIELKPFVLSR